MMTKNTLLLEIEKDITPEELIAFAEERKYVKASENVKKTVQKSRIFLEKHVKDGTVIYGVNTGMGGFVHKLVSIEKAPEQQKNLIQAVATNVGPLLPPRLARATMLARIISLSRGCSAISLENFNRFIAIYNAGIIPEIPSKGSLGTSGDLGPLAAMAAMLTGSAPFVLLNGKRLPTKEAFSTLKLEPLTLSYKEGLALINGTSCMTAFAAENILSANALLENYVAISGLSFEAFRACIRPFHPDLHKLKPHQGQRHIAGLLWKYIKDSSLTVDDTHLSKELANYPAGKEPPEDIAIEDAYSIRCTPQILGPVWDTVKFTYNIIHNEINASSDNPLVTPENGEIFHNGHFHGQYISAAMDYLAIAVTTLCNLSDRRADRFLTKANNKGLPAFLCAKDGGFHFGLMGGQFMGASLTAENRSLTSPVSIQTLSTTGDFQDVVSFGLVAARKTQEIIQNARYIIAFELICAAQAAEFRGIEKLSQNGSEWFRKTRELVPFIEEDISLTPYIEAIAEKILSC
ncbi:phenylalanine aminomutase (D-beta-phenylalanine forming) [Acetobacteraceae bacterium]|nr:phenylalanine aminomutase (D-beta-phenylalanine forming) [Acetobacteraceae bacterium]